VVIGMNTFAAAVTPETILPVQNVLGEGILWDSRRHVLWWTDIQSRRLFRHDWANGTTQILETPERGGSFGLVAGSERPERFLFWPMGIASAGAMRQWGRHATAFVGRRHFDDADLLEKRFALDLAGEAK